MFKVKFLSGFLLLAMLLGNASSGVRVAPVYAHVPTLAVVGWGMNGHNQSSIPTGLSNVVAISAGGYHSLALKDDGTVVAWGCGGGWNFGQCNVPADLTGVTAISGGYTHSLALKSDGTVVAWGDNTYGQATVPEGLTDVTAISAGGYHNLAQKSDGTLVIWGSQSYIPAGLSGISAISAGGGHNLVLKSDGTVVAWGCGPGHEYYQCTVPADLTGVTAIAAGWYFSLALKTDGTVAVWGGWGRDVTPPAGLNNVIAIAAGGAHGLALKNDGTVVAWGDNSFQQARVPAGLSGTTTITGGFIHSLAIGLLNHEPVALNQPVTTNKDTAIDITLVATDSDDDSLTYSIIAGPLHGTLSGNAPGLTYTPAASYVGRDSFTFNASDGELASNAAKVSIAVYPENSAAQVVEPVPGPVLDITQVTVNDSTGSQTDPHLSGDWVSYTDNSTYGIRFQNLDLGLPSDRLIPHPDSEYDMFSDINGNSIAFTRVSSGNQGIYLSQIDSTGNPTTTVELSPLSGALRRRSAVGTDTVAFEDRGSNPSPLYQTEISLSNVTDTAAPANHLTNDEFVNQYVAMSPNGNATVWLKCPTYSHTECDVWRAERTGSAWGAPEPVDVAESYDTPPDTNGPVTVYGSATADGENDIRWSMKDTSGAYVEYMLDLPGIQRNPNISGNLITFESNLGDNSQYDIWLYDLGTNRLYQLTNTPSASEMLSDVSTGPGGLVRVAWALYKTVSPYDTDVYAMSFLMDITSPVITPDIQGTQGQNGWYTSDVGLSWSVTDDESGITPMTGCDPVSILSDQAADQYTCSATSAGGTSSASISIARDATKPVTSVTGVTEGGTYELGSVPQAGCASTDNLSGMATEATIALTGGDAQGMGAITATCSGAADAAGNAADAAVIHYTVVDPNPVSSTFNFTGFFQPVDNPGPGPSYIFNSVKAGNGIPVKFSLDGNQGLDIFSSGSPTSNQVSCSGASGTYPIEETVSAGSSSLSYDALSDTYTYIWKTNKGWTGTCRMLNVTFSDGTQHLAYFQFK